MICARTSNHVARAFPFFYLLFFLEKGNLSFLKWPPASPRPPLLIVPTRTVRQHPRKSHHFRLNVNRNEERHVVLGFRRDWRSKRRRDDETRLHRAFFFFFFVVSLSPGTNLRHQVFVNADAPLSLLSLSPSPPTSTRKKTRAKTENKTPSRSVVLRATNQTNHAKLWRRVLPAHGAIQLWFSPAGVFERAEKHRGIPS